MMFLFTSVFVLILSVRANAASGTEWFLGEDNWDCNQVCSNVGGSCDSSWEATGMTLDDCPWQTVASVYADGEYNCGNTHCGRSGGWGDLGCWYYTGGAGAFHSSNWNDAFACSESRSMAVRICPCIGADSSQEPTNFPSKIPTATAPTDCFSITSNKFGICAISNGAITCWGLAENGQMDFPKDTDFVSVSGLGYHYCGMHSNGAITCWGWDGYGQVSNTPTDTFVAVSVGYEQTCGLKSSGVITCWGRDNKGQASPPAYTDFIAIACGGFHTCGLRSSGAIACWGSDSHQQVSNTPTQTDFVAISGGWEQSCGLRSSGAVMCWGSDYEQAVSSTPTDITDFVSVSSMKSHNCGLRSSGALFCWGSNSSNKISDTPTHTDFVAVSGGSFHTCGLRATGAIMCWGRNDYNLISDTPTQNDFVYTCGRTEPTNFPSRNPTVSPTTEPTNFPSRIPTPLPTTEPTNFPSRNPTPLPTTEPTRFPTLIPTLDPTKLGYVDDCEWHELNKKNKFINSEQFFGFECPPNQVITDVRLQGNEGSVLNDNPIAISCCKLGGHSVVTDTCIDSFSNAAGGLDEAICEGNSAMVALYDLSDPTLDQSQWQYQGTKGITCCEIDYDTVHGKKHDFGIDRSNCQVISHSSPAGIFEVACPADMVLVEIRDNDPANGVQEVHEISCCPLHDMAAPTQSPTSSEPSTAPTTSCHDCLINARGQQGSDQEFVSEVEACLSLCCV